MKKKKIIGMLVSLSMSVLLMLACITIADMAYGQPGPPPTGGPSGGPPCWPPPCIPIDGGIGFLIIAGALYGGKKSFDLLKKRR